MKVQCLLQKFTLCCIAQDLRMLHIKMIISHAVQKLYKQTEMANSLATCKKQATNRLTSVQLSRWARSAN